jgi:antitoxin component YwqK of YwqJK toxin-antitoxin module
MTGPFILLFIVGPFLMGLPSEVVPLDSLSKDETAIAAHIQGLRDDKSDARLTAARALRLIVAKYPSRSVYIRSKDAGEAYWTEKVNQVKPGMTRAQVLKILPPFPEAPERMKLASGQRHWDMYRLDYHWTVQVLYDNPDKVSDRPTLIRRAMQVHVEPPKNYTGTWITWHVNGQKGSETQYQNGKYNGAHTSFHDNGQKMVEQHYKNHVADGAHAGWHGDGKKSYTGQYRNGKQDGKWLHWHANGQKQSEATYSNGEYDGVYAHWHDNGTLTSLQIYRNGVKDGLEAAWSEQGVLQYKRFYQNGSIVSIIYP